MADQDDVPGQEDELEALEEAVSADDAADADDGDDGEELDPLAEEMLKMMESEGDGGDGASSQGDVDSMMEMEMIKAMEQEGGGVAGTDASASMAGGGGAAAGVPSNIRRLMDVSMVVSIELGRAKSTLETVMDLGEQSLVELDKTVGDPVDVLVNGRLFARGEVVTISENFGVRITELLNAPGEMQP
jgi:flagellar motor switch protein FliN